LLSTVVDHETVGVESIFSGNPDVEDLLFPIREDPVYRRGEKFPVQAALVPSEAVIKPGQNLLSQMTVDEVRSLFEP